MLDLATNFGAAAWMASGAVLALVGVALRQKLAERRDIRQRGDWASY